jgi:hypothetical protein
MDLFPIHRQRQIKGFCIAPLHQGSWSVDSSCQECLALDRLGFSLPGSFCRYKMTTASLVQPRLSSWTKWALSGFP